MAQYDVYTGKWTGVDPSAFHFDPKSQYTFNQQAAQSGVEATNLEPFAAAWRSYLDAQGSKINPNTGLTHEQDLAKLSAPTAKPDAQMQPPTAPAQAADRGVTAPPPSPNFPAVQANAPAAVKALDSLPTSGGASATTSAPSPPLVNLNTGNGLPTPLAPLTTFQSQTSNKPIEGLMNANPGQPNAVGTWGNLGDMGQMNPNMQVPKGPRATLPSGLQY